MATTTKIPQLFHRSYRPTIKFSSQYSSPLQIFLLPFLSQRHATGISLRGKVGKGEAVKKEQPKKKKKARLTFRQYDLKDMTQFSLCDAMRYIRAFEVGQVPTSAKYDLALRLRTTKNGPAVRNRLRLPHPVNTSLRIAVICPSPSPIATAAQAVGASVCGEDELFDQIREGKINFERLLCHTDSAAKLNKAGLGKVLGPRGLMPSTKLGTITRDVEGLVKSMVGSTEYREKLGVIRASVGQLGFTPEEMQSNIRVFMEAVKRDLNAMSDKITKEIHEVVLSSTHAPGFSLSGEFKSDTSPPTHDLAVL